MDKLLQALIGFLEMGTNYLEYQIAKDLHSKLPKGDNPEQQVVNEPVKEKQVDVITALIEPEQSTSLFGTKTIKRGDVYEIKTSRGKTKTKRTVQRIIDPQGNILDSLELTNEIIEKLSMGERYFISTQTESSPSSLQLLSKFLKKIVRKAGSVPMRKMRENKSKLIEERVTLKPQKKHKVKMNDILDGVTNSKYSKNDLPKKSKTEVFSWLDTVINAQQR